MRASARWRRARRDAGAFHRRTGAALGSLAAALLAWRAPLQVPSLLSAAAVLGLHPVLIAALAGLIIGYLITPVLEFAWHYWRASSRIIRDLEQRLASLEGHRSAQPTARVTFEYDRETHKARVHVTNDGEMAVFKAYLSVDGAVAGRLEHGVFAAWEHTDRPRTQIAQGQTCTLWLATLDLSRFPFAQWQVRITAEGKGTIAMPAMHASVIGASPDEQAPTMVLGVAIVSAPDLAEGIHTCAIALHPFSAERLTTWEGNAVDAGRDRLASGSNARRLL